jgi:hypothetical protein
MSDGRVRWRINTDELCHAASCSSYDMMKWARAGYIDPRAAEPRNGGLAKHITREFAQRLVLFTRCLDAGIDEWTASSLIRTHKVGDYEPIIAKVTEHVTIKISKDGLP